MTLQQLGLNEALAAMFYAAERAENLFVANLLKKMDASNLPDAALTAVTDIGRFYSYEITSIFKVNESLGRFELLAEAALEGATGIGLGYTQRLDVGLLGLAYQRGEPVILDDVSDGSEDAKR